MIAASTKREFRLIGLTGGIASGKSTAAKHFVTLGVPILDADKVSRALSAPGGLAHDLIKKELGTVDRAALREIVFKDAFARAKLESILHPLILQESLKQAASLAHSTGRKNAAVLYEAALLIETGRHRDLDGLIVVEAPLEDRIKRLVARDRISEDMARRMTKAQVSDEMRQSVATHIIRNVSDDAALQREVEAAAKRLNLLS